MASSTNLDLLDATLEQEENPSAVALAHLRSQHEKHGHVWLPRKGLSVIGAWYAKDEIGNQYIAHPEYAKAEVYLAHWIRKRMQASCAQVPTLTTGLTPSQVDGARLVLGHMISCLSGLPGTGKTYTMKAVCRSLEKAKRRVVGCALTGAAAARLRDSAEVESTTIHRLLQYNPRLGGFLVDQVEADDVVLDEASMPDAGLLLSLCSRLPSHARLILVGDPNQLPGVQPGDVFRECTTQLPHARLLEIIRQEADSPIGHAALCILRGDLPANEDSETGDGGIYVVPCAGLGISEKGKREGNHPLTIAERMSVLDGSPLCDIRTMACTNDLVDLLNDQFNRYRRPGYWNQPGPSYRIEGDERVEVKQPKEWVKIDSARVPVMCIKNRHDLLVYNGDMGYKQYRAQIINGRMVTLRDHEQRDGWAVTPWKMQGNECISAQLYCDRSGWGLDRRVTYTALTRAKRRFVFTGDLDALRKGIQSEPIQRISLLAGLIKGTVSYVEP